MTESSHPTPDLEDLAAYLDGRLSVERKARVEERLVRDEGFYEVFLQTVRFQEESRRPVASARRVIRWRPWRFLVPLAAAALVVLVIGLPRLRHGRGGEDLGAFLDPQAVLATGESWANPGWSSFRSAVQDGRRYSRQELAFRIGAQTVELRIALGGDDGESAEAICENLEEMASAAGLRPLALAFGDLKGRVTGIDELDSLRARLQDSEARLARSWESTPDTLLRFRFGQWVEAVRLAALARDLDALARLGRVAPEISEGATLVAAIESVLEASEPREEHFRALTEALSEVIRTFAD